jgi:hypothetical protein
VWCTEGKGERWEQEDGRLLIVWPVVEEPRGVCTMGGQPCGVCMLAAVLSVRARRVRYEGSRRKQHVARIKQKSAHPPDRKLPCRFTTEMSRATKTATTGERTATASLLVACGLCQVLHRPPSSRGKPPVPPHRSAHLRLHGVASIGQSRRQSFAAVFNLPRQKNKHKVMERRASTETLTARRQPGQAS